MMADGSDIFSLSNIRKSLLKFFENLFRHVLQETEGIESTTGYDFSPEVRKFEKFACESGFIPASAIEQQLEIESLLEMTSAMEIESLAGSASAGESAPASGSVSASEPALASESASGYAPGCASAIGYVSGCESESGYASASGSASGYAAASEIASGFAPGSSPESGTGFVFDFSEIFDSYDRNLGLSIRRVLDEVAGADIDQFYQSVKEKIQVRKNLKIFLVRLADKFLQESPERELYFFAIISRIFTLLYKTDTMDPKIFIEEVTDIVMSGEMISHFFSVEPHELLLDIINDTNNWIRGFRGLKCGEASDYFST